MDALDILLDEVALEGLDGITIPCLWIRLEQRSPKFPLKLDSYTKEYIWKSVVCNPEVNFYELPKERNDVVLFDRFADIDPDTGIQEEAVRLDVVDVYPVLVVLDNKTGLQGSSVLFKERKDVTRTVRTSDLVPCLTLEEAFRRWGRRLVLVASQAVRFQALIGDQSDPELTLTDHSYCILERLGRARWQGELQRDLHGNTFKTDAGKLHYMRKSLNRYGLITMQSHVIRLPSGAQQHSILLLLKRFHVDRRSKYDLLMEATSNALLEIPDRMASMITLRDQLHVSERTFKRVYQYMQSAKLIQVVPMTVENLNPNAGPCNTKRGTKIVVRCAKLLKPYVRKDMMTEAEDDDDEDGGGKKTTNPPEGRIMEQDVITQAYRIVVSSGTKGISQSTLRARMNVGKLESRMICRLMERADMIKGFMEDEGRQRTTKYISHLFVGQSDHLQQFAKEKEYNDQLRTVGAGATGGVPPRTLKTPKTPKTPARTKTTSRGRKTTPATPEAPPALLEASANPADGEKEEKEKEEEEEEDKMWEEEADEEDEEWDVRKKGKGKGKGKGRGKKGGKAKWKGQAMMKISLPSLLKQTKINLPIKSKNPPQARANQKTALVSAPPSPGEAGEESQVSPGVSLAVAEGVTVDRGGPEESVSVVEDISRGETQLRDPNRKTPLHAERRHQTYRLLKRKNLIIESVRSLKIIEGVYTLQKMINDEEKQDGVATKCCKKSILRLIRSLSREGLLKLFKTTVIQDGVSKKLELVVHPSITPSDPIVKSAIEQVRFRMSSSFSLARLQHPQGKKEEKKGKEREKEEKSEGKGQKKESPAKALKCKTDEMMGVKELKDFKPPTVPGMSRFLGFQPKMPRLRLVHNFLWYLIYGHPLQRGPPLDTNHLTHTHTHPSDPQDTHKHTDTPKHTADKPDSEREDPQNAGGADAPPKPPDPASAEARPIAVPHSSEAPLEDEGDATEISPFDPHMTVYVDELSWKRYLPPAPIHREFGHGWALTSDILLSLPLSIFVQIIQISFSVDGLEAYMDDPVKQHYLIRFLPSSMKRQLLHKRKYIYSFHESMQRLCYMGLLRFGPTEKFQDKDQVFVYLKRCCMVVDTTTCEPHYNLVSATRGFDRRQYTLNTAEDIENFWFDLLCVCLNTPLGVVRHGRGRRKKKVVASSEDQEEEEEPAEEEEEPAVVHAEPDRYKFLRLQDALKGSKDVDDEACIPGDGKGAGGLDSDFFGHLKRNWIWTSYLLKKRRNGDESANSVRLRSLLSKHTLSLAVNAGSVFPAPMTNKLMGLGLEEEVQVTTEPTGRNQKNKGGKDQKRKRAKKGNKKEGAKPPCKKRKVEEGVVKKRAPAHDAADRSALKRMTRQRVTWTQQEDSLLMLCSVASHFLNSKLRRPFVPWCVVRDLLHSEFEDSLDKTSLAVGRRSRYILKNPQTQLNFKISLAEVYQDKPLMENMQKKKPNNDDPKECAVVLGEFVTLLRLKFGSTSQSTVSIPDTKTQLFSRFKVYVIEDGFDKNRKDILYRTEDIHHLVLENLIQSTLAMSNNQMKSCRSFQTFHTYSKYRQEVLYQVFLKCRRKGLVNRRRVSKSVDPKRSRALPILPMSYQLSQSYYRCFTWRFPMSLCKEVHDFLKDLGANEKGDRPVSAFYHERGNKDRAGEEKKEGEKKKEETVEEEKKEEETVEEEKKGEETVEDEKKREETVEEKKGEETVEEEKKDNVETEKEDEPMESEKGENMKEREKNREKGDEEDERMETEDKTEPNQEQAETEQPPPKETSRGPVDGPLPQPELPEAGRTHSPSPFDGLEPLDVDGMLQYSLDAPGGAVLACLSLMTMGLLSVYVSIPKHIVVVDSNMVDNEAVKGMSVLEDDEGDEDGDEDPEGRKRVEVKSHQASHANYLMMRGYCSPGIVNIRNLNINDSIVVESCTMHLQLRRTPAHTLFTTHDSPPLDLSRAGPSLLPPLLTRTLQASPPQDYRQHLVALQGYTPQDLSASDELRGALESAGAYGLDKLDLLLAHTHLETPQDGRTRSLQQYLQDLLREEAVLELGGGTVRLVLREHAAPWLLTSTERLRSGGRVPHRGHRDPGHPPGDQGPPAKRVAREGEGEGGEGEERTAQREEEKRTTPEGEERKEAEVGEKEGEKVGEKVDEGPSSSSAVVQPLSQTNETAEGEAEQSAAEDSCDVDVCFVSRPWRIVDGSLNRPVCKGMMEAVLYHIMSKPGLAEHSLIEHYRDVLQPVAVLDLVQAMMEMGCLRRKFLSSRPKPSLFSSPGPASMVRDGDGDKAEGTVFYEPTVDCCLRLGQVFPREPNWNQWLQFS